LYPSSKKRYCHLNISMHMICCKEQLIYSVMEGICHLMM
jgi:hypothetical protein